MGAAPFDPFYDPRWHLAIVWLVINVGEEGQQGAVRIA
jgi:hypothetical protein